MVTFTEPFRANFRVVFLLGFPQGKLRREAVVATDSASVDADCDNGVTFNVLPRHGRREGAATRCVVREARGEAVAG
jgi:hypothetical protein